MALTDKNIVITPNIGSASDPQIVFSGADASLGPQNITVKAYPTNSGTLSFEGSAGQLFSITNSLTGTIFSVNDISGIPSIEVLDTGAIRLAPFGGDVTVGNNLNVKSLTLKSPTGTNGAVLSNPGDLRTWKLAALFSVGGQETAPTGITFKADGTACYIVGSTGDDITQYSLSSPWNIATATFVTQSINLVDTVPEDLFFRPDGLKVYVVGSTDDAVREYNLGTAWDISTLTFVQSFSVAAQDTVPTGIFFRTDGTKMFISGNTNDRIYEYNLGTAWNVSTAVFSQFFSVSAQENGLTSLDFDTTGTIMWITGTTSDSILQYNLSSAWNISTATYYGKVYIGWQELTPTGIWVELAQNKAYVVGSTADAIFQYDTSAGGLYLASDSNYVTGTFDFDNNVVTHAALNGTGFSNWRNDGTATFNTLNVNGTATLTGGVSMTTTTGAINIHSSQTTGTTVIGGVTSATGTITVGRSTAAQTLDLAVGATANATTKTVNIGTAGLSGSTTNITVGSAVTGANVAVSINGTITMPASALGGTLGNTVSYLSLRGTNSNANNLDFFMIRDSAGTSWTTSATRIQQKIDATWHAWQQFNGTNANEGIEWGTGSSTVSPQAVVARMRLDSAGSLRLLANVTSTTTTSGSLIVTGGVGVSGAMFIGGAVNAASLQNTPIGSVTRSTGAFTTLTSNAATTFTAGTASTTTTTGTLVVTGGVGVSGRVSTTDLTVTNTITGSVSGNAGTVTNGLYTTGGQTIAARTIQQGSQNVGSLLTATGSLGGHECVSAGSTDAAFMTFHRPGNYASYFGIDTDNQFAVGGWSAGAGLGNMKVGSFGVGTAASGTAGEIRATNNITAYFSSDARLKENITDIDNSLDIVCAIGSKMFDWTDEYIAAKGGEDGYFVQKSDFGVIAQDVEKVFPTAVRTRQDGTMAVDYEKLATLAFGAIKEQQSIINDLVARIEQLENK